MTTTIQFRVDPKSKKEVEKILDEMGLDLPTAFRAFMKKIQATRSIPFRLQAEPEVDENGLTPKQVKAILKASDEARRGINTAGPFSTMEDLIQHLNS